MYVSTPPLPANAGQLNIYTTGTLVHYYENEADTPGPPGALPLPSSATGRKAVISVETLKLAAKVRASGAKLVLVSGTRYSTLVGRLPFLPRADAYVIENGGRIFYPKKKGVVAPAAVGGGDDNGGPSDKAASAAATEGEEEEKSAVGDPALTAHAASALEEDLKWRETMESATGPASQDAKGPEDREGPLWDLYRKAVAEGFEVDTNTYYTMIRCRVHSVFFFWCVWEGAGEGSAVAMLLFLSFGSADRLTNERR